LRTEPKKSIVLKCQVDIRHSVFLAMTEPSENLFSAHFFIVKNCFIFSAHSVCFQHLKKFTEHSACSKKTKSIELIPDQNEKKINFCFNPQVSYSESIIQCRKHELKILTLGHLLKNGETSFRTAGIAFAAEREICTVIIQCNVVFICVGNFILKSP
jgi:hypothetical protein